jgi:outer membrane receptor for ferrienterochelin and colicins
MWNGRLQYENSTTNWFGNIRAIYRSKWAVNDRDGNGLYNDQDEFASGYLLLNTSAGKTFFNRLKLQAGIDNILNYTDVINLPNMPGRVFYGLITYTFIKTKTTSKI